MNRFLSLFKKQAVHNWTEPTPDKADKPAKTVKKTVQFTEQGTVLVITSPFGPRSLNGTGTVHKGVDIRSFTNDFKTKLHFLLPENARFNRLVSQKNWGDTLVFRTDTGRELKYTHILAASGLHYGKKYKAGETVCTSATPTAYMKQYGFSEHLHFEVWENGEATDPLLYFDKLGIKYRMKNAKD